MHSYTSFMHRSTSKSSGLTCASYVYACALASMVVVFLAFSTSASNIGARLSAMSKHSQRFRPVYLPNRLTGALSPPLNSKGVSRNPGYGLGNGLSNSLGNYLALLLVCRATTNTPSDPAANLDGPSAEQKETEPGTLGTGLETRLGGSSGGMRGSVSQTLTSLNLSLADYDLSDASDGGLQQAPDFIMLGEDSNYGEMSIAQIEANIQARRNRIFQLMEEVRRLRIQQRIKAKVPGMSGTQTVREVNEDERFPSALPYFPPINKKTIKDYLQFYWIAVTSVIAFGGLFAPLLEVRMGLGGQSYYDFITTIGLPEQLAEVDPIVASFCGGMVGVLSALLVVEINNEKAQSAKVCTFCQGSGYLTCGICAGSGIHEGKNCNNCASLGKVMCTSCAATGKKVFSEHDPRIDPFN